MNTLSEIWHARCPVPTPVSIAVQLGWVETALREQCNLSLKSLHESNNPVEAVTYYESPLPNSFRQGGSVPALFARAAGQQTVLLGLTWTDEFQAVVAMPGSGIASVRDLRGRRIGVPRHDVRIDHSRAAALRGFSALLASESLSFADVELVDLPDQQIPVVFRDGAVISQGIGRRGRYSYTNEVKALASGLVDAIYVKDAHGAQAAALLGADVVINIGRHPDPQVRINNCTPRPLTVSRWLVEHHPEVVSCLLQQVVAAGHWARQEPERVRQMIGREIGWSENWVSYAYGENVHENLHLDLAPRSLQALGDFKQFLLGQGFLAQDFSIDDWLAPPAFRQELETLNQALASGKTSPLLFAGPLPNRDHLYH